MGKIVIELTNRCNLKCQHCFTGRHGGRDDLSLDVLRRIVAEAKAIGFNQLSFTGGDPTIYRHFLEAIQLAYDGGYLFGFNTNGWNFASIYHNLLPYREKLAIITFSLDGAGEATHDRLRGKGSFHRVMQAVSVCVVEDLPFTFNMVVTAHNRHEVPLMAERASRLGARGLRFGHLMPTRLTTSQGFDLSPWERKVVEAEIWGLRHQYPLPITMAPGYHTTDLFPCAPLNLQELNVDCFGNLTKCCHLSGHTEGIDQRDIIGNLKDMTFEQAYQLFVRENELLHQEKVRHLSNGDFRDADFFPCWYCSLYYDKVAWLREIDGHPWANLIWEGMSEPE